MRKNILSFICFLPIFNSPLCVAQNTHKLDSLLNVIATAKADTSRFYAYASVIRECSIVGNFEVGKAYGDTALQLGNQLLKSSDKNLIRDVKIGMAQVYKNIGSIHYYEHDYALTDLAYLKALSYLEEKNDNSLAERKLLSKIFHNLGLSYTDQGKQDSAIVFLLKSLQWTQQNADKSGTASNYMSIGVAYYKESNYTKALDFYFKGLQIVGEVKDDDLLCLLYNNIGLVYEDIGNLSKALNYFKQSLKIAEMTDDQSNLYRAYINLGNTYDKLKNYPDALSYYRKALDMANTSQDEMKKAQVQNNIGEIYAEISLLPTDSINIVKKYLPFLESGNTKSILLDSSISNHVRSLVICNALGIDEGKMYTLKSIGEAYVYKSKFDTAISYFENAAEIATRVKDIGILMDISKDLSYAYLQKKDYKNALKWNEQYHENKDAIFNQTNEQEIGRLEQKFESEKEIAILNKNSQLQNAEIKRQKLTKYYFFAGSLAMLVVLLLFYKNYRTKQLLKLQTLRNRIASDLHDDIGSTLTSISIFSELAKAESKEVLPLLENIGESSRKMLESMADIVWTINPENDNFEKIIWRMRSFAYELLRAKNIEFEFTADESVAQLKLPMEVRKNLYLIFKEAINNMAKYSGADSAFLSINGTKNHLSMLIRDNGKGFDVNQASEGNGLKNMKKRAEEIGAQLLIESGTGLGTTIQFLLKIA